MLLLVLAIKRFNTTDNQLDVSRETLIDPPIQYVISKLSEQTPKVTTLIISIEYKQIGGTPYKRCTTKRIVSRETSS